MNRNVPLRSNPDKPLRRNTALGRNTASRVGGFSPVGRTGLRPVSKNRQRENQQRRALITQIYPERPGCVRPGCTRYADDIHENLSRARSGGNITDPDLWRPLCRRCHDEVTFRPESELQWAYDAGLLVHSWDATRGAA